MIHYCSIIYNVMARLAILVLLHYELRSSR